MGWEGTPHQLDSGGSYLFCGSRDRGCVNQRFGRWTKVAGPLQTEVTVQGNVSDVLEGLQVAAVSDWERGDGTE